MLSLKVKIPLRHVLIVTLRHKLSSHMKEVKCYVKIYDRRTCEAL